jgi:hypothetical protein
VLLYFGQLLAFGGCLALGFTVRSADVHCAMQAVRVPLPVAASVAEQQVPCDADETSAQPDAR